MSIQLKQLALGQMGTNCYLVWCEDTKEALIIDPGFEAGTVVSTVKELGLKVKMIVNTHGHLDHIGANRDIVNYFNCPVSIGVQDAPMLTDPNLNFSAQMGQEVTSPGADTLLNHGDKVTFGNCSMEVLTTPGHTPGGICLYGDGLLISGDSLFAGSIGRTDLPGGDHEQLIASIQSRLLELPDDTRVLPGHGPESTIGEEKINNPWL